MLLPNTPTEIFLQSLILLLPLHRKESEVAQHNLFPNFKSLLRSYPPPHILFYIACFSFLTVEHIVFCSSGLYLPTISLPGLPPLLLLLSHSVVSDSLWPDGLQHTRLPCLSLSPGVCSNSCPSSWWSLPTISCSVIAQFKSTNSLALSLFLWSNSHIHTWLLEKP